jgi:hypothetical protein
MGRDLQVNQLPALLTELKNWCRLCLEISRSRGLNFDLQVSPDRRGHWSIGQEDRCSDGGREAE